MSASTPAARIANTEHRGRPGLALLLGLLGLPGVTLAWDLPLGGYWIGLPLAVAAIVLGAGARGDKPALCVGGDRARRDRDPVHRGLARGRSARLTR
jgi:hypothetical protein